MTDEDRDLLAVLVQMKDTSGKVGLGFMEHSLSQEARVEMGLMIFDMIERVFKRVIDNLVVVEGDSL
jgi:hypothetical protein